MKKWTIVSLTLVTVALTFAGGIALPSRGTSGIGLSSASQLFAESSQKADTKDTSAQADEEVSAEKEASDRWMLAKRHHVQEIFRGLTDGDFELMESSGRRMVVTGILEKWMKEHNTSNPDEYQKQLKAFEAANRDLIRHAEAEDIDGALKAYVAISQSCVHCHKLLRDEKTPRADRR
ncbi:MAG: hypothetical protein ACK526_20260 [Planctomyces sp.]|jgi:hypothetical protein